MKKFKEELFSWLIEVSDDWHKNRSDFFAEMLGLFLILVVVGLLGWLIVLILITAIPVLFQNPIIILIILGAIAVIVAIPVSIVFLGKHIKANQE